MGRFALSDQRFGGGKRTNGLSREAAKE